MSYWAVYLTVERANPKALNRAFILMQDFDYSEYPADSRLMLLTSKEMPSETKATSLPLPEISTNAFAGTSLADVNTFVRSHADFNASYKLQGTKLSAAIWLVIDQKGLETSTCLVCEQYYDSGEDGENGEGLTDQFRACRIPYEEAWIMMANLDVANMGFEEYVDEDAGKQEDGSWKWKSFPSDSKEGDAPSAGDIKRAKALQELRDGGYAD
ncbi:hypothetical protein B0H17DRAFT_1080689 [Mycena rosella]|uniref:DUF6924 domain-containing protein n=1 Tax=Mycena rosella TaxID=1033263 RepID=A0AAD7G834_MYCRO|nr:hypothetical protein B0H17DRAFT_1080689 [Mycena rosella]